MNPIFATDGYKTGHHLMYAPNTTRVLCNFTPRSNKYAPNGINHVVVFGVQAAFKTIVELFDTHFFKKKEMDQLSKEMDKGNMTFRTFEQKRDAIKAGVLEEIQNEFSLYLGSNYDVSHFDALWRMQYLPIEVRALEEGTLCPIGVPTMVMFNTLDSFYWLPNFLETIISTLLWKPMTSATIAYEYKKLLTSYAKETDKDNLGFVEFQGHDFSMRGMDSIYSSAMSGLGHSLSFSGSDTLPSIIYARKLYNDPNPIVHSVNATEHSVMCSGTKEGELQTFERLLDTFPTGILSIVSDTWDLWKVHTHILPKLKDRILARDGKVVIRPDSGDPVDILCGIAVKKSLEEVLEYYYSDTTEKIGFQEGDKFYNFCPERFEDLIKEYGKDGVWDIARNLQAGLDNGFIEEINISKDSPESKGVIELLWDIFGGTVNSQGFKVLDPHIGAIYGDSITLDRAKQICERLKQKGFASTNVVLGIGSFTYQYNTRDTFGFAVKTTYIEKYIPKKDKHEFIPVFKDPVTDSGDKKSARGLLEVHNIDGKLTLIEHEKVDAAKSFGYFSTLRNKEDLLIPMFRDGEFVKTTTITDIRKKLKEND